MEARIHWIPKIDGGRDAPPSGPRYATVARFPEQGDLWRKEAWSLVVEFTEAPDSQLTHRATISYLNAGPAKFLAPGKTFELLEGDKVVARGQVL